MARRRPGTIGAALRRALDAATIEEQDGAAVELALRYADAIDFDLEEISKAGPKLLDVLVELRMTPKARQSVLRDAGGDVSPAEAKLDELRAHRARRAAPVAAAT